MAIRSIVLRGYGNGTFNGTIALVTLRGYTSAEEVVAPGDPAPFIEDPSRPFTPGHIMSNAELNQLLSVQTEILADSCSIERNEQQRDTQGGVKDAWRIVNQDVACRISPSSGSDGSTTSGRVRFLGDTRRSDSKWQLTLLTGQDISVSDRVRHDSRIYEVTLVNEGRSFETVKRVMLRLLM